MRSWLGWQSEGEPGQGVVPVGDLAGRRPYLVDAAFHAGRAGPVDRLTVRSGQPYPQPRAVVADHRHRYAAHRRPRGTPAQRLDLVPRQAGLGEHPELVGRVGERLELLAP